MKRYFARSDSGDREPRAYSAPTLLELGSIVELTLGDGTSTTWDIGPGFKKAE